MPTETEDKPFDSSAFIASRNSGNGPKPGLPETKPAELETKTVKPETDQPKPETDQQEAHLSRSQRREMNRLREAAAEERGQRLAWERIAQGAAKPQAAIDPNEEPNKNDFKTDAEYAAAVAKWAVKQEVSKTNENITINAAVKAEVDAANEKQAEQTDLIPNWKDIFENADELDWGNNRDIEYLFAVSDVRPFVVEHFYTHREDWDKLLELKGVKQLAYFARIEGKCETVYNQRLEAAQAAKDKTSKDRTAPEKAEQAREIKQLPRPSSEVSATGGSVPLPEPTVGSAAWMAARNAKLNARVF
jgi:hypothetical protein